MKLVAATQIEAPVVKVSPPFWVLILFWVISAAVFVAASHLPVTNAAIKFVVLCVYGLALLAVARRQLKGNYLVTLQANRDGLFFQTDDVNRYLHVPWKNVGVIEKAMFPLNTRGLRVEITGDLAEAIRRSNEVGNVRTENRRTFVYTIPQLRNRDRLIEQFVSLRNEPLE